VSAPNPFGKIELSTSGRAARAPVRRESDAPFRILIMGDFSGRKNRGVAEALATRRCVTIDIDNFDAVLERMQPRLDLTVGTTGVPLTFATLDDFHPDRLFARVPLVRDAVPDIATPGSRAKASPKESDQETLARLLGREDAQRSAPPSPATRPDPVHDLIAQAVAAHIVPPPAPGAAQTAAATDLARSAQMRALLHQADLQALEAAWRSVDSLVRNLETGEGLAVSLLDVSADELRADLERSDDLTETGLFKKLVEETVHTPGATPWSLLLADFFFSTKEHDARCLARAGKIAEASGAPLLTGLQSALIDAAISRDGLNDPVWRALRSMPHAASLGVAAPRILLRLPYGKATEPIDAFAFEELESPEAHDELLWGNPAFGIARLIAEGFLESGWEFTPGDVDELTDLPHHTWRADGEAKMTPCAERWLTDVEGDRLLAAGIMPLLSIRGRNAVKAPRMQAIADPAVPLRGPWTL
jgi:type VI secretion system protein ImpC